MALLAGFEKQQIETGDASIAVWQSGQGAPLLLLHGYPQTHLTWASVAPGLAQHFTCILVDLPGYGESRVLQELPDHAAYSKRQMADVLVRVMGQLGHREFAVLGHDRGARVAYRMALDHRQVVTKLGIIEVIPTADMWRHFDADMGLKAYHWPFLAQPAPLPETLIAADPQFYTDWTLQRWTMDQTLDVFSVAALTAYRAQMADPARVHAMCEDYRAGAGIDRLLDEADRTAGHKIAAPLHFVWGKHGFPAQTGAPLDLWQVWADTVTGNEIETGHFAPEENPQGIVDSFLPFFR